MTPRVDAHHHVWDLTVRDQPWTAGLPALRRSFDLAELEPALRGAGIDATVLVQTVDLPEETPEFLAIAEAHPVVAGVVGWVDLTAPEVADQLA
ncbi:MAG: L-fuconolactonase, partial [Pseudonocardiales bacterium]|nr:L-fuconolactonase [Pseudonocardiales bacterium]